MNNNVCEQCGMEYTKAMKESLISTKGFLESVSSEELKDLASEFNDYKMTKTGI